MEKEKVKLLERKLAKHKKRTFAVGEAVEVEVQVGARVGKKRRGGKGRKWDFSSQVFRTWARRLSATR